MLRVLLVLALCAAPAVAAGPNVVLIIGDDQGYGDFGFMGSKTIRTPHLDKLAAQSVVFPNGYVPNSLCRPSLATILTGRYVHQHKISGNDPPRGTDRGEMLRHVRRWETLPRWLGTQGYVSLQTGKWWEGAPELGGFTEGMTHGDPKRGGRHGDVGLKIGREGLKPITDFLDHHKGQPFFLWYAPMLPHTPHNPPARLLEKYTAPGKSEHIAKYQAMCEWFDETCGELLGELDRRNLAENTLVIHLTDNGWIQNPNAPRYAEKSKRSPNEGGLRTPIVVRWPGKLKPGRNETLVSSIDVAPTILAACGLSPKEPLPGLNLLEVANTGSAKREALFGGIYDHDVADIDVPAKSLLYRWCRTGPWKLILPADGKPGELYDISRDPTEEKNVAAENREVVTRLTALTDQWWKPE